MVKTKQPEPEVTDADVRHALGLCALTARAIAGDMDAAIWFLIRNGGPEWQPRDDAE